MHERQKVSSERSYGNGLVLLGISIALVVIFYQAVSRHGLDEKVTASRMDSFLRQSQGLDEGTKDGLRKSFAGFWEFFQPMSEADPLGYKDRLEVRDNGIIWQVKQYDLRLVTDSIVTFYHVVQGFIDPFSRSLDDTASISCEVRIIRQVFVLPGDTCYGASSLDFVWRAKRAGDRFTMDGYSYVPSASMVLDTFFPPGMIKLIDYMRIDQCPRSLSFKAWAMDRISSSAVAAKSASPQKLIEDFYDPIFIRDAVRRAREAGVPVLDTLRANLRILPQGTVDKVSFSGKGRVLKDSLAAEIRSWRFDPQGSGTGPVDVNVLLDPLR